MSGVENRVIGLQPGTLAVLGVPFDENSSFRRGPSLAPARIREGFHSESSNLWTESGVDLGATSGWQDLGDLDLMEKGRAFAEIERALDTLLAHDLRVVTLGGDHSITYPILRAYAKAFPGLSILQLDAHPDTYDELDGNRHSHACPFARIMEEGLASRLVQVGIRAMTGHQREQAKRFGIEVLTMRQWRQVEKVTFEGPVYLSLDLDCLDPAFAPGVSHHEPGGLSTREVLGVIHGLRGELVGADIVEYNPERDPQGITGMAAAKLLKEILGRMLCQTALGGQRGHV
ncbi:MAG: agmatinase [Anaerolineae bacterium]|jgi:agmatinase